MSSEKKTIQINPELFKLSNSNNKTRRKKNTEGKPIRIKSDNPQKPKNMGTIKKNILKMIRNHQEEKIKQKESGIDNPAQSNSSYSSKFQSDFNDSLDFLQNLTDDVKTKQEKEKKNQTIRRYPSMNPGNTEPFSSYHGLDKDVSLVDTVDISEIIHTPEGNTIRLTSKPATIPQYGCLKNGNLPTFRNWKNQTQKNTNTLYTPVISPPSENISIVQPPKQENLSEKLAVSNPYLIAGEKKLEENIKELSRIQQINHKVQSLSQKIPTRIKRPRQKKMIRRTYHVGKSKVHPRISVLVSNKTIRSNTTLKAQQLKQTPIAEVKKYLLKNGFIKIGTNAPNDVLRQMYECTKLICGEVKNHNPENLLYNYFNDTTDIAH
jgi:hypothetical protein